MKVPYLIHHASLLLAEKPVVYVDPYEIPSNLPEADYIFITHSHYDHLSLPDIKLLLKPSTIIICPVESKSKLNNLNVKVLNPFDRLKLSNNVEVYSVPAYNINKPFHPKSNNWLGYIITVNNIKFYHTGDTDFIPEMKKLSNFTINYAFFPVGGTYTMNAEEAADACNVIKPEIAVPMHYGKIIGTKADAEKFKSLVKDTEVQILK